MKAENSCKRWTDEEDEIVAQAVLKKMREGGVITDAVKDVTVIIGRSEGTCMMRWYSVIKPKYHDAIQLAKSQRGRMRGLRIVPSELKPINKLITVDDITSFMMHLQTENEELRNEVETIRKQLHENDAKYKQTNEDYQAFLKIMDRARKSEFLTDHEEKEKQKFKMDRNGNLERIN